MVFTEKTNFQISLATFIVMIIFMVGSVSTAVTWKIKTENYIENNTLKIKEMDEVNSIQFKLISENEDKALEQEIFMAEIRTDLKWIRTTLETLKEK